MMVLQQAQTAFVKNIAFFDQASITGNGIPERGR